MLMNHKLEGELNVWVSRVFLLLPLPRWGTAAAIGALLFVIGLIIAALTNLVSLYVSTRLFWLAAVGIAWVCWWLSWGCDTYPSLLASVAEAVHIDQETAKLVMREMRGMSSAVPHFSVGLGLTVGGIGLFYFVIAGLSADPSAVDILAVPRILPEPFYDGTRMIPKLALLAVYLLPGLLVVTTTVVLFIRNFKIMQLLAHRPLSIPYVLSLSCLDKVGSFHAKTATSWFGGIAIVILAAESHFTPLVTAVVVALSSLGFLVFFLPQYRWHLTLEEAKRRLLSTVGKALEVSDILAKPDVSDPRWLDQACNFVQLCELSTRFRTWTFDYQNVLLVFLAFAVPVASAVLRLAP